jgi:ribonuclease HI
MFIETDGACSGNPGPGGWGFVLAQENRKIEAYGANAATSHNETKLQDIDEALSFFTGRAHVVIESDSQGCPDMMMGTGEQWQADNYITLMGDAVKNRKLVGTIKNRLKTLNVQFGTVKGHNYDQWNDAVDALAVTGRDDAIAWPECSFDVVMPGGQIPFPRRSVRESMVLSDPNAQLSQETHIKIPGYRELKVYKNGNSYSGLWADANYQLVHSLLPTPQEAAPKKRPVISGIYDGHNFKPTHPIDIDATTEAERLDR